MAYGEITTANRSSLTPSGFGDNLSQLGKMLFDSADKDKQDKETKQLRDLQLRKAKMDLTAAEKQKADAAKQDAFTQALAGRTARDGDLYNMAVAQKLAKDKQRLDYFNKQYATEGKGSIVDLARKYGVEQSDKGYAQSLADKLATMKGPEGNKLAQELGAITGAYKSAPVTQEDMSNLIQRKAMQEGVKVGSDDLATLVAPYKSEKAIQKALTDAQTATVEGRNKRITQLTGLAKATGKGTGTRGSNAIADISALDNSFWTGNDQDKAKAVEQALLKNGYPPAAVKNAIERAQSEGFLWGRDFDAAKAKQFVESFAIANQKPTGGSNKALLSELKDLINKPAPKIGSVENTLWGESDKLTGYGARTAPVAKKAVKTEGSTKVPATHTPSQNPTAQNSLNTLIGNVVRKDRERVDRGMENAIVAEDQQRISDLSARLGSLPANSTERYLAAQELMKLMPQAQSTADSSLLEYRKGEVSKTLPNVQDQLRQIMQAKAADPRVDPQGEVETALRRQLEGMYRQLANM